MSNNVKTLQPAALVRRVLFFVLLISMILTQLFIAFNGLKTKEGIELAQVAREISRGHGFSTQVIRPVTLAQSEESQSGEIKLYHFPDTMHAPLSPMVHAILFKAIGADDFKQWQMRENEKIYALDRIIASVSVSFFMVALCISYFLIARIFDSKIAGVTALLILLCDLIWQFSLSGLPQMMMLMLMSAGLYFTYRGVESAAENQKALGSVMSACLFFVLLALTNWLCIFILLGFLLFTIFYFRPRGAVATFGTFALIAGSAFNLYHNYSATGTPLGTAFLTSYNSDADLQALYMRSLNFGTVQFDFRNLLLNLVQTSLTQITDILSLLGGIIVAPLFFLSLLHPFKRKSIADFRWCVLLMWVMATLGMTIFGLHDDLNINQLHLLFIPIMSGYGLAIVAIFWARLGLSTKIPALAQAHYIIIILLSSGPMVLTTVFQVKDSMAKSKDQGMQAGISYPYFPDSMNSIIHPLIPKTQAIVTDQPEAVAWYADRTAIWLPLNVDQFEELEELARNQGHHVAAILITPSSHAMSPMISADPDNLRSRYSDFAPLIIDGPVSVEIARNPSFNLLTVNKNDKLDDIQQRYVEATPGTFSGRVPLLGGHLMLYRNNNEKLLREARKYSEENDDSTDE